VDHIIPRSVAPELDNLIANLELMPQRMNAGKRDRGAGGHLKSAQSWPREGAPSSWSVFFPLPR
jgi:hypothetical protein